MKKKNSFLNLKPYGIAGRWPTKVNFSRKRISDLSEREAMGLEEYYIPCDIDDISKIFKELIILPKTELISLVESLESPFKQRYVAGKVLALLGDPRINVLNPNMVPIESYKGKLGLHESEINRIVEEYKYYGIIKEWIEKESPEYEVDLKPFKIAKYPVTNQEYLAFMTDTKHNKFPTSWYFGRYDPYFSNHPVYTISADSCIEYCKWLSAKTQRKFRLPTEAEWEYMAAGPDQLEFPWGDKFLPDYCNTVETGIYETTAIGSFSKGNSVFGCSDVAGNIEEFVSDYYKGYASSNIIQDDLVTINGKYRVARGGSFARFSDLARTKRRHGPNPSPIYIMGFRIAEDY